MNGQMMQMILMLVVLFGVMYFISIRPQQKKDKELRELIASIEVGDSVLTTSGFYGIVTDVVDESTIIVEFGNDKHCRIPMTKTAVQEVEKPGAAQE